ncbi:MAG: FeoB-associated Cys-rich membrane protein [Ruminococcaceae bacterium]|nr:FeoB-associated Cys-rich membrane protein [Oscillospiraceae bacterium]
MTNIIIVLVLIAIVALATCYICKEKRRGSKCIGCPYSKSCNGGCRKEE